MKKRLIAGGLMAIAIVAGLGVWQVMNPTSSHHAIIRMRIAPEGLHGEAYTQQRQTQVDQILPIIISKLQEAGLADVTESNVPLSTAVFGYDEGHRILKFKGQATGRSNTMPLEAIVVFDARHYELLHVHLSEAFSKKPSARLSSLHAELDRALEPIEGNSYASELW